MIHFFHTPPPPPPFMCPGTEAQQAFRTEPRNLTVHKGATAVLRCEVLRASGTVQWAKDGLLLGPQQSLPGFPRYSMIGSPKRGKQTRNKVYGLSDLNGPIRAEGMNLRKAGSSKITLKSFIIDLPGLFIFINIQRAWGKLHSSRKVHLGQNGKKKRRSSWGRWVGVWARKMLNSKRGWQMALTEESTQ